MEQEFVYFITDGEAIKIGRSMNVAARLQDLQVGHARRLKLIGYIPGVRADEAAWHDKFASIRMEGEWFELSDLLLDRIEELALQGVVLEYKPMWRGQPEPVDTPLVKWVTALSKLMFVGFHDGGDPIRKIRCATIFENCRRIIKGDDRPELRRIFLANIADLEKYDAGYYDAIIAR